MKIANSFRLCAAIVLLSGLCMGMTQNEALTAWPKTIEHTWYLGQYSKATVALMVGLDAGRVDDGGACRALVDAYVTTISAYPGPLDPTDIEALAAAYEQGRKGDAGCN